MADLQETEAQLSRAEQQQQQLPPLIALDLTEPHVSMADLQDTTAQHALVSQLSPLSVVTELGDSLTMQSLVSPKDSVQQPATTEIRSQAQSVLQAQLELQRDRIRYFDKALQRTEEQLANERLSQRKRNRPNQPTNENSVEGSQLTPIQLVTTTVDGLKSLQHMPTT